MFTLIALASLGVSTWAAVSKKLEFGNWGDPRYIIIDDVDALTMLLETNFPHYVGPPRGAVKRKALYGTETRNTLRRWQDAFKTWYALPAKLRDNTKSDAALKEQNICSAPDMTGKSKLFDLIEAATWPRRGDVHDAVLQPQNKRTNKFISFSGARNNVEQAPLVTHMVDPFKDQKGEMTSTAWHPSKLYNPNIDVNHFVVEVNTRDKGNPNEPVAVYVTLDNYWSFFKVTGNALENLMAMIPADKRAAVMARVQNARAVAADDWLAYDADYFEDAVNDEDEDAGDVDGDEQYFDDDNEWDLFLKRLVREEEARERVRGDGRGLVRRKKHHS